MRLLKTNKRCYICRISHPILPYPGKALYEELLTLFCIISWWFKSSLYSEWWFDSSVWNRLLLPNVYAMSLIHSILHSLSYSDNITPIISISSTLLNEGFAFDFGRWLIVSLVSCSQGTRQKYFSAGKVSLEKLGQNLSKSGTAPQTGSVHIARFIMSRSFRAMTSTLSDALRHCVFR